MRRVGGINTRETLEFLHKRNGDFRRLGARTYTLAIRGTPPRDEATGFAIKLNWGAFNLDIRRIWVSGRREESGAEPFRRKLRQGLAARASPTRPTSTIGAGLALTMRYMV